ncbi:hypothetical protein K458DRAFT_418431 [Lentithecium fluviatile CBS 122367]|uniref:Uncharacterized protein n=1 Tax=Lentithecium fluviatile CBS 122367 TaxID=1168545 RepID=A0A6G1J1U2_9PLEO|nr:hypothetical protein K458DRAFT_418431 [Lentithecium fluviatile CBS 122367]
MFYTILNTTMPIPASDNSWQADGDTGIAILFGTMQLLFAGIQVIIGWQGVRALRRGNAVP